MKLSGVRQGVSGSRYRAEPVPAIRSSYRLANQPVHDSGRLDGEILEQFGTEVIAPPHGVVAPRAPVRPDTAPFCRRWKAERLFAWLRSFRRLVLRYEYHAANYLGVLRLACAMILRM